jgi:hypothetical protein
MIQLPILELEHCIHRSIDESYLGDAWSSGSIWLIPVQRWFLLSISGKEQSSLAKPKHEGESWQLKARNGEQVSGLQLSL